MEKLKLIRHNVYNQCVLLELQEPGSHLCCKVDEHSPENVCRIKCSELNHENTVSAKLTKTLAIFNKESSVLVSFPEGRL